MYSLDTCAWLYCSRLSAINKIRPLSLFVQRDSKIMRPVQLQVFLLWSKFIDNRKENKKVRSYLSLSKMLIHCERTTVLCQDECCDLISCETIMECRPIHFWREIEAPHSPSVLWDVHVWLGALLLLIKHYSSYKL